MIKLMINEDFYWLRKAYDKDWITFTMSFGEGTWIVILMW